MIIIIIIITRLSCILFSGTLQIPEDVLPSRGFSTSAGPTVAATKTRQERPVSVMPPNQGSRLGILNTNQCAWLCVQNTMVRSPGRP